MPVYLSILFIVLSLNGCKVSVDSSDANVTTPSDANISQDSNNSVAPDTNSTVDTNSTHNDTNTTQELLYEAPEGSEYDPNACYSGFATAVPLQDYNSNESPRESDDDRNGISLMSLYTQTLNPDDSLVIAFYKNIPEGMVLGDVTQRENVYGDNSQFVLIYDPIWKNLQNNIVYVQTPALEDKLAKCYRIVIEETTTNVIEPKQVYRYKN